MTTPRTEARAFYLSLTDVWQQYDFYSARVSETVRSLSFSLLGAIWLLAKGDLANLHGGLVDALVLLLAALSMDFLQYLAGGWVYGRASDAAERREQGAQAEIRIATWKRGLIRLCYRAKAALLILSALTVGVLAFRQR